MELDALESAKEEQEYQKFKGHNVQFDFHILIKLKAMIDVSSNFMELPLKGGIDDCAGKITKELAISFASFTNERIDRELIQELILYQFSTIHRRLPVAITFDPELRLTHRLRLRGAYHLLYASNLGLRYGYGNCLLNFPFQFCQAQEKWVFGQASTSRNLGLNGIESGFMEKDLKYVVRLENVLKMVGIGLGSKSFEGFKLVNSAEVQ
ncbi:hypothetical protein PIB30_072341 [Stylosanthes scabra]|uniref:Uncharacterized protein n=1 Tax=Stylosanthes scabra TaxID=79078 RepID=A0ABU6ZMS8_9FABA|nr:hypothetical protein [Stylosanthes scabra]